MLGSSMFFLLRGSVFQCRGHCFCSFQNFRGDDPGGWLKIDDPGAMLLLDQDRA
jgi:hypothetical protein